MSKVKQSTSADDEWSKFTDDEIISAANPNTISSRHAALQELNRRADINMGIENYLKAEVLYGKGIEILSYDLSSAGEEAQRNFDIASFHMSRSLARFELGKYIEVLKDLDLDKYLFEPDLVGKVYLYRGLALYGLNYKSEALVSLEKASEFGCGREDLKTKDIQIVKDELSFIKEIAKELHDDDVLFKDPPKPDDCPICFLPMSLTTQHNYQTCCGKFICCGCLLKPSFDIQNKINGNTPAHSMVEGIALIALASKSLCPFCRAPTVTSAEKNRKLMEERLAINDPDAFYALGLNMHVEVLFMRKI